MLVLSRKVSERIWIGEQICVTIVRINGNAVRVGIDAPAHLAVVRDELKQRQQPSSSAGEAVQLVQEPQPQ
jgi:carbon storage regulator